MAKAYDQLVAKAESAVSKVKDPELRRLAFERILDDLLGHAPKEASSTSRRRPTKGVTRPGRGGPQAYVSELAEEGFFKKPKTIGQVEIELENRGHHIPQSSLSGPLQILCQRRILRRQKTKGDGAKPTFNYSNW